jgi:hypothetical protein
MRALIRAATVTVVLDAADILGTRCRVGAPELCLNDEVVDGPQVQLLHMLHSRPLDLIAPDAFCILYWPPITDQVD